MQDERGSFVLALTIAVVGLIVLIWVVADACFEDEDETNDLGQAPRLELVVTSNAA